MDDSKIVWTQKNYDHDCTYTLSFEDKVLILEQMKSEFAINYTLCEGEFIFFHNAPPPMAKRHLLSKIFPPRWPMDTIKVIIYYYVGHVKFEGSKTDELLSKIHDQYV